MSPHGRHGFATICPRVLARRASAHTTEVLTDDPSGSTSTAALDASDAAGAAGHDGA